MKFFRTSGVAVFSLGLTAMMTQIILVREFLSIFSGNELILGLILSVWLILTGIGTFTGKLAVIQKLHESALHSLLFLLGLFPLLQVFAVRSLKRVFVFGTVPGIWDSLLAILVILLPFCILSGILLTAFCRLLSKSRKSAAAGGRIYYLDTLGSIAGGLVFSLFLVHFLEPFLSVSLILVINMALLTGAGKSKPFSSLRAGLLAIAGVVLCAVLLFDPHLVTTRLQYPGQEIVSSRSTPYGRLVLSSMSGQWTLYQDGSPLVGSESVLAAEEAVHFALSQHDHPQDVLLVGGVMSGCIREIAKYQPDSIVCVEADRALFDFARELTEINSYDNVVLVESDGRQYIKQNRNKFDVILVVMQDPSNAQFNRYYTDEFFTQVRQSLRRNGVFAFSLSGGGNYVDDATRSLHASIYLALEKSFPNNLILPGSKLYYVASEAQLNASRIGARLREKGIDTAFVREEYLRADLSGGRLAAARDTVQVHAPVNTDLHPVSYGFQLRMWLKHYGQNLVGPAVIVFAIIGATLGLVLFYDKRREGMALATSGFSGMGLEMVLLTVFQTGQGSIYLHVGLILTAFLGGSAWGAFRVLASKRKPASIFLKMDLLLVLCILLFMPLLTGFHALQGLSWWSVAAPVLYSILNGLVGYLVGSQFTALTRIPHSASGQVSLFSRYYTVDLLATSAGAILVGTYMLPALGVYNVCLILGLGKFASSLFLLSAQKSRQDLKAVLYRKPESIPLIKTRLGMGITLLSLILFGLFVVLEETSHQMYAFSKIPTYHGVLLSLLFLAFIQAVGYRYEWGWPWLERWIERWQAISSWIERQTGLRPFRWLFFGGFGLVVFYPLFRCFFKVPYIFCHVCPRKCIFGIFRPYLVPSALLLNLERRFWCSRLCPVGSVHQCEIRAAKPAAKRMHRWIRMLSLAVSCFVIWAYFGSLGGDGASLEQGFSWYEFFYKNAYTTSGWVLVVSGGFLILGLLRWRPFCECACPVGLVSEGIDEVVRKVNSTKKAG